MAVATQYSKYNDFVGNPTSREVQLELSRPETECVVTLLFWDAEIEILMLVCPRSAAGGLYHCPMSRSNASRGPNRPSSRYTLFPARRLALGRDNP